MTLYKGRVTNVNVATQEVCLLSVVGKLCGRVLIKIFIAGTECSIGEE